MTVGEYDKEKGEFLLYIRYFGEPDGGRCNFGNFYINHFGSFLYPKKIEECD